MKSDVRPEPAHLALASEDSRFVFSAEPARIIAYPADGLEAA